MTFLEKIKTSFFWKHSLRMAFLFFILLTIFSLLFNSFSDILKFDLAAVEATNFADGKWKKFIGSKAAISIGYSMFINQVDTTFFDFFIELFYIIIK